MFTNRSHSGNWREMLKELYEGFKEYNQYKGIMTAWERSQIERSIVKVRSEIEPAVLAGAVGEWNSAITEVEYRFKMVEAAKHEEVRRWDAAKLTSEMQMNEMLIKQIVGSPGGISNNDPEVMNRLQKVYQDAQSSGDMYKQRAAAEVFTNLLSMVGGSDQDRRMQANSLAKQAQRDAEKSRAFPKLEEAEAAAAAAVEGIKRARNTLIEVDCQLEGREPEYGAPVRSFSIDKELGRVKTDERGNIIKIVPLEKVFEQG
ncbi:MAG: hypothetical protein PHE50_09615 [Dehalococcoidales bacterium]|nr:hypothetical protein [Dehalococcoidales bacterium]